MSSGLEGLGLAKNKAPILPLTREDIIGQDLPMQDDAISMANSLQSSGAFTAYTQRKNRTERSRRLDETLGSRMKLPRYFKRLFRVKSLDFESTLWDMLSLLLHPKMAYKSLYYQKETKNKWARDDPSFVIVLSLLLTISAIAWGITYSNGILGVLKLIVYMVFIDFLLVGVIIATVSWFIASKFFVTTNGTAYPTTSLKNLWASSPLEWAYCFDVHCNSYLIIWVGLYLIQFVLLPLLRLDNFLSTLIGNTLYLVSLTYYTIVTFYGYNTLPFLHKTEYLLTPIPVLALLWLFFTLSGFNMARFMSKSYFG